MLPGSSSGRPDAVDWTPLGKSSLWQLQKQFYARSGPRAWTREGGVPSYATSNPFFAEKYVDLLVALSDCGSVPIVALELGGGSGELAFLILQLWMERCWRNRWDPSVLLYVLTDMAESNIRAFVDHPQLMMHAELGVLDVAQLDVTSARFPVWLRHRQRLWQPNGPTVVVASYLFDSLPLDVFSISAGPCPIRQMYIGPCCELGDRITTKMEPLFDYSELSPELFAYLAHRRDRYRSPQAFTVPVASVSVILWLQEFFQGTRIPGIIIIADKGRSTDVELFPPDDPELPIARHNSFSFPVNFQCLGFVAHYRQGFVWESASDKNIKIMTCAWNTSRWVHEAVNNLNMLPSYLDMYRIFTSSAHSYNLFQLLAMLQSSCFDPRLFFLTRDRFWELLPGNSGYRLLRQFEEAFHLVTRRCFALQGAADFIFELGHAFLAARSPRLALINYRLSTRLYGYDAVVLFRMALVLLDLGDDRSAKFCLQRAILTDPSYTRSWLCLEQFFMD